jgi:hypothetical protein
VSRCKEEVRVCDGCNVRVSDQGEIRYGGSMFTGWLHIELTDGGTSLTSLRRQREWDYCCEGCMLKNWPNRKQQKGGGS